ncbi:Calmodulin-binding protein 25 [Heracleum sosnowskyi]|uniref:Calmodulin-binding protein 25 n=1 Tax=Heracleum sosnowskyi TaxID=360622 RepID=A0AAD8IML3_9APIA|nr:Calmodulin-binding protein 25 [Heracleum sosnowskyi]
MNSSEPWNYRPVFTDSWLSEAFARDTDTLTNALHKTFYNHSDPTEDPVGDMFYPLFDMVKPESTSTLPTPSVSGSDPDTPVVKRRGCGVASGKISKRKSRASKKNTTTFINADASNFRQMVQQVTGVKFGNGQVPVASVLKPEPQRMVNRFQGCLPTLDTSAFLLDHQVNAPTSQQPVMGYAPASGATEGGGGGFDFESFSGFPTLESWKVM